MDLRDRLSAALAGRYEIEREIGRGGMAVVYLARDLKLQRRVAMKVLRPEFTASLIADRFVQEIQIAARLEHPLILPLYESDSSDGLLWYSMPYIKGETLYDRLTAEKQLPVDEAVRITCEVAEALSYAHGQGVVHRDIKPANILFSDGHPLVADFGIAKAFTEAGGLTHTATAVGIGTPGYMSPEQATGEKSIDPRTDIYSLACVLYEMLAGETPYTGPTAQAIIAKQLSLPVPSVCTLRETVSPALDEVLRKALAKVPPDRFSSAREFVAALAGARRRGDGTSRQVLGFLSRLRKRRLAALLGVVVVVSLVAGGWLARAWEGRGASAPSPARVAVLYFDDLTEGRGLAHIAAGVTHDLIDELTRVPALDVLPASAVRLYRANPAPLQAIVGALHAGTIVEGEVDSAAGVLRVRVRLIDGATGRSLASHLQQAPGSAPHTLGRELAAEIAQFLRRRIGREVRLAERRAGTFSGAAWDLVQRAEVLKEDASALRRSGDLAAALRRLHESDSVLARAATLDPNWIEPVILRGWVTWDRGNLTLFERLRPSSSGTQASGEVPLDSTLAAYLGASIAFADRALTIRDDAAGALALRGAARHALAREGEPREAGALLDMAEQDLQHAVVADPGQARAWHYLSRLLQFRGKFAEAAVAANRALATDAYLSEAAAVLQTLIYASLELGRFDSAMRWCSEGERRFNGDPRFEECSLAVLGWSGRTVADAARAYDQLVTLEAADTLGLLRQTWGFRRFMLAAILARAGATDSARALLEQVRRAPVQPRFTREDDYYEAYVRTVLGDRDEALRLLVQYLAADPLSVEYVARNRWFSELHGDPRFAELVAAAPQS